MPADLLVVAGEASGDHLAAAVLRALGPGPRAWGVGGSECAEAGLARVAGSSDLAAMGALDVVRRAGSIARVAVRVGGRALRSTPRAALLVDATELNSRLGRALRARGTRVLWCVAPQVWAWRASRLRTMRGCFDKLACVLPFEEPLWRAAGHDARYVGHPALDRPMSDRAAARGALRIGPRARALALLPGSRAGEVRRHLEPFVHAAARLRAEGAVDELRLIIAPGLDAATHALALAIAHRFGIGTHRVSAREGLGASLPAFDASIAASGTACLEAALAGAHPVIAYRLDALAYAAARHLVRVAHIGLPNIVLGRRAYPELVQREVRPEPLAAAARALLSSPPVGLPSELRARLQPSGDASPFGVAVADMLRELLGEPPPDPALGER